MDSSTVHHPRNNGGGSALHIPSLDGLRAVSFAIVFISHGGLPVLNVSLPGGFGVTVFFFLSGYLITTLMRLEYEKSGTVSLKKFYLRRSLRILPPFYIVFAGAWAANLVWNLSDTIEPLGLLAQALHYTNYWAVQHTYNGLPVGTAVYWSLAVEEHFYLLFPFIFIYLARSRAALPRQAMLLLAICMAILGWRVWIASHLEFPDLMSEIRLEIASDTRFDSILFGCVLALYGNPALDSSRFTERTWKYVLLPAALAGLLASFLIRDDVFRQTFRYSLQGLCLIPVFVCAVRYPGMLLNRPLNWRPMAVLGGLSYSLYLVHQVVIAVVQRSFNAELHAGARSLLMVSICMGLAGLLYFTVERPCARLRRRLRA